MVTNVAEESIHTLYIRKEIEIAAPIEIAFEALLAELGPEGEMPGGRWFRDLGNNSGHYWGHVQVIKPPKLLEICGPLFMSYPAVSHVQYRLAGENGGTRVTLSHRALGLITDEHREGVLEGWSHGLNRIREIAERRASSSDKIR